MTDRIEKQVELNAPLSRVWRALADPNEFGQWFRVKLDGPFVVGQVSRGFITYPGYEHVRWEATIEAIEPERLLRFRWPHPKSLDQQDYAGEPTTIVEFRLEPLSNGTRLLLTESGFDALPSDRRADAFRSNEGGWTEQMKNVANHIAATP